MLVLLYSLFKSASFPLDTALWYTKLTLRGTGFLDGLVNAAIGHTRALRHAGRDGDSRLCLGFLVAPLLRDRRAEWLRVYGVGGRIAGVGGSEKHKLMRIASSRGGEAGFQTVCQQTPRASLWGPARARADVRLHSALGQPCPRVSRLHLRFHVQPSTTSKYYTRYAENDTFLVGISAAQA